MIPTGVPGSTDAALFRIIIRRADWPRGRTYLGVQHDTTDRPAGVLTQTPGATRQPDTVPLFTRPDAVKLIPKLRELLPADASVYLKAEGRH